MMLSTMPRLRAAFTSLKGPKFSDMNQGLNFMGQEGVVAQRPVPLEPKWNLELGIMEQPHPVEPPTAD